MGVINATITVTDLRRQSAKVLANLPQEKLYLLLQNSRPKGALVDLAYLKMLQEAFEDYLDIQTFDQTIKEPAISWKKYKKQSLKIR